MERRSPLLITMGDPAGIGPEIIVKAFASGALADVRHALEVVGDPGILLRAAAVCGLAAEARTGEAPEGMVMLHVDRAVMPVRTLSRLDRTAAVFGRPGAAGGRAMAAYITWACDACLTGRAAGMITAPISKAVLRQAGIDFPGHTELLAARCGVTDSVMMLAGDRLKVCLVTTHCAYREVPQRLSRERIVTTLNIAAAALTRDFGCDRPRLAVLALNPHAGENGLFGDEERRLIAPAIADAQRQGIAASGPHSADTLFWFAARGDYDAVICMYHDQGLIPLKLLHFEDGVNVTLGLPIIRTSVDHGTAYDLAGTGQASPASLVSAVRMADRMATSRH